MVGVFQNGLGLGGGVAGGSGTTLGGCESNSAIFPLTRAELRRNNPAFSYAKSIVFFLNVRL
jgi:hypothetical protein